MLPILASLLLAQAPTPDDASAPLRRFPIAITVRRPGQSDPVSILRVPSISPGDELELRLGQDLSRDFTFAMATLSPSKPAKVASWNLWDRKYKKEPVKIGKLPTTDMVVFFLVRNPHHDGRAGSAIKQTLDTSSEKLLSANADYVATFQQQDRLLNFINAYSALPPTTTDCDPAILRDRVTRLGADLGVPVDPSLQSGNPNDLRRGLSAGLGLLTQLRKAPDDPNAQAVIAQSQLPGLVASWVGLVTDLMHVFIKPRREIKLTFVPASAAESQKGPDGYTDLVTQRVLETQDSSLPAVIYRPAFERVPTSKPIPVAFERTDVMSNGQDVALPLGPASRDLFTHPEAWDWKIRVGDGPTKSMPEARLVPGRGVVFPVDPSFFGTKGEQEVTVSARVGWDSTPETKFRVVRVKKFNWAATDAPDLASGDGGARIVARPQTSDKQPFFRFAAVTLVDSAGKPFPATGVGFDGSLSASFNLSGAAPGMAQLRIQQEESSSFEPPVPVFIAPKRPNVGFISAERDNVVRVVGPDARYVQTVHVGNLTVAKTEDLPTGERAFTLSGAVPANSSNLEADYRDPDNGNLAWKRTEPLSVGAARPRFAASLMGSLPDTIGIGVGADASWATASLPAGTFRNRQPVRLRLAALPPFSWTHDVTLELGFGPASDIQSVATVTEGPAFAIDGPKADALLTLDLDAALPKNARRGTGVLWFRIERGGLASPWTLAQTSGGSEGLPLTAVQLPSVVSVAAVNGKTRVTLGNADGVVGVRFPGSPDVVAPTLTDNHDNGLGAYVDGPADATEFELVLRNLTDSTVKVKVTKKSP